MKGKNMISQTHIGRIRSSRLMSQPDMVAKLNEKGTIISYRRLVNIETKRTMPTDEEKKAIAKILGVSVKEAFQ